MRIDLALVMFFGCLFFRPILSLLLEMFGIFLLELHLFEAQLVSERLCLCCIISLYGSLHRICVYVSLCDVCALRLQQLCRDHSSDSRLICCMIIDGVVATERKGRLRTHSDTLHTQIHQQSTHAASCSSQLCRPVTCHMASASLDCICMDCVCVNIVILAQSQLKPKAAK